MRKREKTSPNKDPWEALYATRGVLQLDTARRKERRESWSPGWLKRS